MNAMTLVRVFGSHGRRWSEIKTEWLNFSLKMIMGKPLVSDCAAFNCQMTEISME